MEVRRSSLAWSGRLVGTVVVFGVIRQGRQTGRFASRFFPVFFFFLFLLDQLALAFFERVIGFCQDEVLVRWKVGAARKGAALPSVPD